MAKSKIVPIKTSNPDSRTIEIDLWLEKTTSEIPNHVLEALAHYKLLLEALAGDKRRLNSTLLQLRRALGITASSEKRKNSGNPIGGTAQPKDPKPKDPKERRRLAILRFQELEKWHKKLAKKLRMKLKKMGELGVNIDDFDLTEDEIAESEKESAEHIKRLNLGNGEDSKFESSKQAFMLGGGVRVEERDQTFKVSPDLLVGAEVVKKIEDKRTRFDFSLVVTKINLIVEKLVIKDEGTTRIISASTRELGPPKMDVTWEFVANMMILVSQYAMPFNRICSLLSTPEKRFTTSQISRLYGYVARRFLPIYLHNFKQLANSDLLAGDDTNSLVLSVSKFLEKVKEGLHEESEDKSPWHEFANQEVAEKSYNEKMQKPKSQPGLGILIAKILGFEFDKKDGSGQKKGLHTTVLWGRSEPDNPRSAIVFYRSHLGGFGNLLTACLAFRNKINKKLLVQSDLSTVNLVTDPKLKAHFDIELIGRTSHARRPFALYEQDDPEACLDMQHLFKGLYIYEKGLDLFGRNEENVKAVREIDSRPMWEDIRDLAKIMANKWSGGSKLGIAARYIIRHYSKLTAYLNNSIINISNDFSERMLRMENLIEANCLFRKGLEGRFALDINRSSLQTAVAADVGLQDYVIFVLKASPEAVEANPENYTALAFYNRNLPKKPEVDAN